MTKEDNNSNIRPAMISKMEKICKAYVEHLENGGDRVDIQNIIIMCIFGACNNTEYRTRLFDVWPTYLEDFENSRSVVNYRYPETLCDDFLALKLDKNVKIIDVACGPGNVAYILKNYGYTNIDGLDPSKGFLDAAQRKALYKNTFQAYVTPDAPTPFEDGTYDVLTCCAGMFPGSIVPQAFKELIRIVKPGGYLIWNIADGYEGFNDFFTKYDEIFQRLIKEKLWECVHPPKKLPDMLLNDSGYSYVMKKL